MSIEYELANFFTKIRYEDLPQSVVNAAKRDIIDTIGVALAGSNASGARELVELFNDFGSTGKCSTFVYDNTMPPHSAALVNSTMAHALDLDDIHEPGNLHVGITIVPAALAISEYLGNVNGKELIMAVVLGIETAARMGLATRAWGGWLLTPLYGCFGAATTASKLLGFDNEGMVNAWGIAYSQAAGNMECIRSGALAKRIQPGFAASAGVISALMASKGITGAQESMGGLHGIFNLYQKGNYDPDALTANLGKTFEVLRLGFKPYPCCRVQHCAIDAALEIAGEENVFLDEIDDILVEVSQRAYDDLCVPTEIKQEPRTIVDAQFSIPYGVATALTRKKVLIEDYTDEAIKRTEVLRTLGKIRAMASEDMTQLATRERREPCRLTVKSGDKIFTTTVDTAKGDPRNPMSNREIELKFRDCAAYAMLPNITIEEAFKTLNTLETIDNVSCTLKLARTNGEVGNE
jgi:2-methylcitrate dehydratase PrpD